MGATAGGRQRQSGSGDQRSGPATTRHVDAAERAARPTGEES